MAQVWICRAALSLCTPAPAIGEWPSPHLVPRNCICVPVDPRARCPSILLATIWEVRTFFCEIQGNVCFVPFDNESPSPAFPGPTITIDSALTPPFVFCRLKRSPLISAGTFRSLICNFLSRYCCSHSSPFAAMPPGLLY